MKSSTVIFLIIICAGLFYLFHIGYLQPEDIPFIGEHLPLSFTTPEYRQLRGFLDNHSMEMVDFEKGNPVFVRFSSDSPLEMPAKVYAVAMETFRLYRLPVYIEGYYRDTPMLRMISSNPLNESSIGFVDIRTPEIAIEEDLGLFDVLVDDLSVEDGEFSARVEYFGAEEDFINDYLAMCFMIVQDVPSIKRITIEYQGQNSGWADNNCLSLSTTTTDLLSLYAEEESPESFLKRVEISKSSHCNKIAGEREAVGERAKIGPGEEIKEREESVEPSVDSEERKKMPAVDSENECPAGAELERLYNESSARLSELMNNGLGDTPEAQEAYKAMKFYRDCKT